MEVRAEDGRIVVGNAGAAKVRAGLSECCQKCMSVCVWAGVIWLRWTWLDFIEVDVFFCSIVPNQTSHLLTPINSTRETYGTRATL